MSNILPNGTIVFRVWRKDGDVEVLAKTQYKLDADMFAKSYIADRGPENPDWFLMTVCDYECSATVHQPKAHP